MMLWKAAAFDYEDAGRLLAYRPAADGDIWQRAQRVEFVLIAHEKFMPISDPTMELDSQSAKSLMTALWNAGVRPHDFKNANGEIQRLEAHLADMRKLVFEDKPLEVRTALA